MPPIGILNHLFEVAIQRRPMQFTRDAACIGDQSRGISGTSGSELDRQRSTGDPPNAIEHGQHAVPFAGAKIIGVALRAIEQGLQCADMRGGQIGHMNSRGYRCRPGWGNPDRTPGLPVVCQVPPPARAG